jgi:hypothetical protein
MTEDKKPTKPTVTTEEQEKPTPKPGIPAPTYIVDNIKQV